MLKSLTKLLKAVTFITPLRYGSYDNVAYQSSEGTQKFRPLTGSHLGDSNQAMEFTVVEVLFSIPYDKRILGRVLDQITRVHIAEEPVVYISETWVSRVKSYEDKSNPNRFWNRPEFEKGVKDSDK